MRKLLQSALLLLATSLASAQVSTFAQTSGSPFRGTPASVNSIGFMHSPPAAASITSIRPNWSGPNLRPGGNFGAGFKFGNNHGRNRFGSALYPYGYSYYAPLYPSYYPIVVSPQDEAEAQAARELRNVPGAKDEGSDAELDRLADRLARRLKDSDRDRYGEHYLDSRERAPEPAIAPPPDASREQPAYDSGPATVLIYRDGHQQEIRNFAIMGDSLYVLSDKHQKIALADLDVEKTIKVNDERGITIRLPKKS